MTVKTEQLQDLRAEAERQLRETTQQAEKLKKLMARIDASLKRPNSRRKDGTQALIQAAGERDATTVRKLLKGGANPNSRNKDGETPLLCAVYRRGNLHVIRLLLDAGADPDLADASGNTPLIVCVRDEDLPVVRQLVEHKADVNARNRDGDTPLTNAACWGSAKVVEYLLEHGADVHLADGAGISAENLARQQGHPGIAKRLAITTPP